jgi:hypothetical protein
MDSAGVAGEGIGVPGWGRVASPELNRSSIFRSLSRASSTEKMGFLRAIRIKVISKTNLKAIGNLVMSAAFKRLEEAVDSSRENFSL